MCSVASEAAAEDRPGETLRGGHGLVCNFIRHKTERNSGASSRCSDVLTLLKAPLWPPTMLDELMEFSRTGGHLRGHLQRLQVSRKASVLHKVISTDSRLARDPVPYQ